MPLTLVIVHDRVLFREGIHALLDREPDIVVVGEAADARSAYELLEARTPDVVLVNLDLPGIDGSSATREVLRRHPTARVVMLATSEEPDVVAQAMASGADGYVLENQTAAELAEAIRRVSAGESYIAPAAAEGGRRKSGRAPSPIASLSPREREVFALVVRGGTNESIAQELSISVKTVETHRARINRKLDVHSSADLVRFAVRNGLMS
jgi:two-component system response regulator NreC